MWGMALSDTPLLPVHHEIRNFLLPSPTPWWFILTPYLLWIKTSETMNQKESFLQNKKQMPVCVKSLLTHPCHREHKLASRKMTLQPTLHWQTLPKLTVLYSYQEVIQFPIPPWRNLKSVRLRGASLESTWCCQRSCSCLVNEGQL